MAHPDAKLPVDTNVPIPPSVKRASEAADAIHRQAYNTQPPDPPPAPIQGQEPPAPAQGQEPPAPPPQPDPPASPPSPQSDPPAQGQEPPARPPVPESGEPGSWEHRYHAMKGRYDQAMETIGSMQGQLAELGDELMRSNTSIQQLRTHLGQPPRAGDPRPGTPQGRQYTTEQDRETYGPELLEAIKRVALDAVAPELQTVQNQTRQANQRVMQTVQQSLYADLDAAVPTWKQINNDPRFKNWCRLPDVYSGQVRGKLLNAAFQAADAPRVIAFFNGFLSEEQATGQMPAPQPNVPQPPAAPRQAAVSLDTLAAPGRAKPATGDTPGTAADKPVFTRAQISAFYSQQGRAQYIGREADRKRDEEAIFAAQRDGRVR